MEVNGTTYHIMWFNHTTNKTPTQSNTQTNTETPAQINHVTQ